MQTRSSFRKQEEEAWLGRKVGETVAVSAPVANVYGRAGQGGGREGAEEVGRAKDGRLD